MADRLPDQRVDDARVRRNFDAIQLQIEGLETNLDDHVAATTNVHGIADTAKLVRTSGTGAESGLRIIRGIVNTAAPSGSIVKGTGFSISARTGTGDITLAFTTAFSDTPAITASPENATAAGVRLITPSASGVRLFSTNTTTGATQDNVLHFIAIGPA
jgi:hypothetical protein